ncbi:MAG: S-layer homology domain-containing protein [Oscillospiraceae bacterium]|nr:S-layer homology domain-containing protein [Oscillospiraceae bacterium]
MKKPSAFFVIMSLFFILLLCPAAAEDISPEKETAFSPPLNPAEVFTSLHCQYVFGDGRGYFAPDEPLTRAASYSLIYNLLLDKSAGDIITDYSDCPAGQWYTAFAEVLGSRGYLPLTEGELNPLGEISRAEFSLMLALILGAEECGSTVFPDVYADSEYFIPIASAEKRGWIRGSDDGLFHPDESLTRAQCVTILNRILGRVGDRKTEGQMDSRFTFKDLPPSHWAYLDVMEASTEHIFGIFNGGEVWESYSHRISISPDWESSESVVKAATITNELGCVYKGDYTHDYNLDYSDAFKEAFVNEGGYRSNTGFLVWISIQNQKVYLFSGTKGSWQLEKTFICSSGAPGHDTPICETYVTYRQYKWWFPDYTCEPIVRFMPNSGYAFHSRPYKKDGSGLYDPAIGQPASLGCIRMLDEDIRYLYTGLPDISTVIVY